MHIPQTTSGLKRYHQKMYNDAATDSKASISQSVLNSERITYQDEYPCSAFFQNSENFEKPPPSKINEAAAHQSVLIGNNQVEDNSILLQSPPMMV